MPAPKVLAFSGSLRADSYNTRLVRVAAEGARSAGAEVTVIELRNFDMPLFNEDLEAKSGMPPAAKQFKELLKSHQGLLIASPEYNSSITAALKNALDWATRPEPGEAPLVAFNNRVCGLLAASPGALGGLRGLVHLRAILGNIGVIVLPQQIACMKAHESFDDKGALKDARQQAAVMALGAAVATTAMKLAG